VVAGAAPGLREAGRSAAALVSIVRFRSGLPDDEVEARFESRADRYRDVPGLVEKIYLRFREPGSSAPSTSGTRNGRWPSSASELARTIPEAYHVEGETRVELADVSLVCRGPGDTADRCSSGWSRVRPARRVSVSERRSLLHWRAA
jgi:hypothetical protein